MPSKVALLLKKNAIRWKRRIKGSLCEILLPLGAIFGLTYLTGIAVFEGSDTPILNPDSTISERFDTMPVPQFTDNDEMIFSNLGGICYPRYGNEDRHTDGEWKTATCGMSSTWNRAECISEPPHDQTLRVDQAGEQCMWQARRQWIPWVYNNGTTRNDEYGEPFNTHLAVADGPRTESFSRGCDFWSVLGNQGTITVRVTMGSSVDYFRKARNDDDNDDNPDLCGILYYNDNNRFLWSKTLSGTYTLVNDARQGVTENEAPLFAQDQWRFKGGSPKNFPATVDPNDQRMFLPFWGVGSASSFLGGPLTEQVGGCCSDNDTDIFTGYGRSYEIAISAEEQGYCYTPNLAYMTVITVNAPESVKNMLQEAILSSNTNERGARGGWEYDKHKAILELEEESSPDKIDERINADDYGRSDTNKQIAMALIFDGNEYTIRVNGSQECYGGDESMGVLAGITQQVNVALLEDESGVAVKWVSSLGLIQPPIGGLNSIYAFGFVMVVCAAYMLAPIFYAKSIIAEKQERVKEGLKIFGMTERHFWSAWYLFYIVEFFPVWLACAGIMSAFKQTGFGTFFLVFTTYGLSQFAFATLVTTFFSKALRGTVILTFLMLGMMVCGISTVFSEVWDDYPLATCFIGPVCLAHFFKEVIFGQVAIQAMEIGKDSIINPGFSAAGGIGIMFLTFVLCLILTLYLDQVLPKQYGARQPLLFFLKRSYWSPHSAMSESKGDMELGLMKDQRREDIQPIPEELRSKPGVKVRGLTKIYGGVTNKKVVAVDGINLDMVEGQVFCLLGHNGAGKTTTMDMLTGMQSSSGGDALIYGKSINTEISEIRRKLGFCPQHDVLFPYMTVLEHLVFYGALRGVSKAEVMKDALGLMESLGIGDKGKCLPRQLSGGMKRKVSLLLSFVGNPKVVFLDEPTSGVDPFARRAMWQMIQEQRAGKVIVLTTHFMDEAEVLGDRIAIMSSGHVVCCGTNLFLKERFGVGYTLFLTTSRADVDEVGISQLMQENLGLVDKVSGAGSELQYKVPLNCSNRFPAFFEALEERKDEFGIEDCGVSVTTLEEVFLKVEHHEHDKTKTKLAKQASYLQRQASSIQPNEGDGLVAGVGGQVLAMFQKRFYSFKRSLISSIMCQWIIPLVFALFPFALFVDPPFSQPWVLDDIRKAWDGSESYLPFNVASDVETYGDNLMFSCAGIETNKPARSYCLDNYHASNDEMRMNTDESCMSGELNACKTWLADAQAYKSWYDSEPTLQVDENNDWCRGPLHVYKNCDCACGGSTGMNLTCTCPAWAWEDQYPEGVTADTEVTGSVDFDSADCRYQQLKVRFNFDLWHRDNNDQPDPKLNIRCEQNLDVSNQQSCRIPCSGNSSYPSALKSTLEKLYQDPTTLVPLEEAEYATCAPNEPCPAVGDAGEECAVWPAQYGDRWQAEDAGVAAVGCDCDCFNVAAHENAFMSAVRFSKYSRSRLAVNFEVKNTDEGLGLSSYRSQILLKDAGWDARAEMGRIASLGVVMMSNAIQADLTSGAEGFESKPIAVTEHALPESSYDKNLVPSANQFEGLFLGMFTGVAIAVCMMYPMAFVVDEIRAECKHQQFVSGVHFLTYWLTTIFWDFVQLLPLPFFIAILFKYYGETEATKDSGPRYEENGESFGGDGFMALVELLFLGITAALSMAYFVSYFMARKLRSATIAITFFSYAFAIGMMTNITSPVLLATCTALPHRCDSMASRDNQFCTSGYGLVADADSKFCGAEDQNGDAKTCTISNARPDQDDRGVCCNSVPSCGALNSTHFPCNDGPGGDCVNNPLFMTICTNNDMCPGECPCAELNLGTWTSCADAAEQGACESDVLVPIPDEIAPGLGVGPMSLLMHNLCGASCPCAQGQEAFVADADAEPYIPFDCSLKYTIMDIFRIASPFHCIMEGVLNLSIRDTWSTSFFGDMLGYDIAGGQKEMPGPFHEVITGRVKFWLGMHSILWFPLVLLFEFIKTVPCLRALCQRKPKKTVAVLDDDVAAEGERVRNDTSGKDIVRIDGLHKMYGSNHAVKGVTFGIPEGEVFGFLGTNGAGKTTTLNMLTKAVIPSGGDAFMGGHSITKMSMSGRLIGYCPQFSALFGDLTAREHLRIYGRVKGLTGSRLDEAVNALLKELYLEEYADRRSVTYSGGNKRKLSVAIALIGAPTIVFLDEPSTGVDPVSRRFMWDYIANNMQGRSVILTTHSMEEAEALSQRIGIIVDGQLRCIGSPQHLKTKFGGGYQLTIQLKSDAVDSSEAVTQTISTIQSWLQKVFTNGQLLETHAHLAKFRVIPPAGVSIGVIFGQLEQAKQELPIESYAISQTSLEQIFLDIAGGKGAAAGSAAAAGYGSAPQAPPAFKNVSVASPVGVEIHSQPAAKTTTG